MSVAAQQGHDFRGWFRHEDNGFLQSPADSDEKPWGANAVYDRVEGSNQAAQVFGPDSRVPIDIVEQLFDGRWGASFVYTTPWWFNAIYGTPSSNDQGGYYTHDWSGEDPASLQVGIGRTASGKERVLKGALITNVTISPSVGGLVQVSVEGPYANEETQDPSTIVSQPPVNEKPMTFADASLSLGGTTFGYVQSGQIQLTNNMEIIGEWGSRTGIDFAPRTLVPSVNFSKINESGETDNLQRMYGDSTATSVQNNVTSTDGMTFTLDNGVATGSGINKLEISLTGAFPDTYGESGLGDPEADVTEEINRLAESASVTATNETAQR